MRVSVAACIPELVIFANKLVFLAYRRLLRFADQGPLLIACRRRARPRQPGIIPPRPRVGIKFNVWSQPSPNSHQRAGHGVVLPGAGFKPGHAGVDLLAKATLGVRDHIPAQLRVIFMFRRF